MLEPPQHLRALEYRKIMKGGNSKPLLVVALDREGRKVHVVLKLRHPMVDSGHWEGTSLACELICSVLARAGGLRVPDYYVVDVSTEFARSVPDRKVRETLEKNIGPNYGSKYLSGFPSWPVEHRATGDLLDSVATVLALDATIFNADRSRQKPNLLWTGRDVIPIDHSYALPVHAWTDEQIEESPLFPEDRVRRHATWYSVSGTAHTFSEPHTSWCLIPWADITAIRDWIPESWERSSGDLNSIFSFLGKRDERFSDISTDLQRIVR